MHPLLSEAMMAARRREMEVSLARPRWVGEPPPRRRPRVRPARVAIGMHLIGLGLRLVDA